METRSLACPRPRRRHPCRPWVLHRPSVPARQSSASRRVSSAELASRLWPLAASAAPSLECSSVLEALLSSTEEPVWALREPAAAPERLPRRADRAEPRIAERGKAVESAAPAAVATQ